MRRWQKISLACASVLLITGLGLDDAYAVGPFGTVGDNQDFSKTTGGSEINTQPVNPPVVDNGSGQVQSQNSNQVYVPSIGGGGAGSVGNNYSNGSAPSYSYRTPSTNGNGGQYQGSGQVASSGNSAQVVPQEPASNGTNVAPNNNEGASSAESSGQGQEQSSAQGGNNSQSSSSTSSSSSSASSSAASSSAPKKSQAPQPKIKKHHQKHYSKRVLRRYAKKQYRLSQKNLKAQNKARIVTNNQKGATDLKKAYRLNMKKIASGEVSKSQRSDYVIQQKKVLQQALNTRLGTLQTDYNNGQKQVSSQINSLPNGHQYDKQAMALDGAMKNLDYQLGHKSDLAYSSYNESVNQLLVQTADVKDSEKAQQRLKAKKLYQDNLNAVEAEDPAQLVSENRQRVSDLKDTYHQVRVGIASGEYSTPQQIWNRLNNQS